MQPVRRLHRRPLQPPHDHLRQPVRLVRGDVVDGTRHDFHELMAARALMGISEAFYIPAALALIADYHRASPARAPWACIRRAFTCGLILGGFAGYVADSPDHGWRWAFTTCGMIGDPLRPAAAGPAAQSADVRRRRATTGRPGGPRGVTRGCSATAIFILLVLYFTLPAIAGWVVRDWMPDILKEKFRLGQGKAGVTRHALLADRLARRRGRRRHAGGSLDAPHAARPHLTPAPSA